MFRKRLGVRSSPGISNRNPLEHASHSVCAVTVRLRSVRFDLHENRLLMYHRSATTTMVFGSQVNFARSPEPTRTVMDQRYQIDGFLPWRGPFVLDVIVIGMVFVL